MGASTVMNNCRHTQGVGCDYASDEKCSRCGFNPAVRRVRVAKIKAQLLREMEANKKLRKQFVYYAPQRDKEATDGQD